MTDGRGDVRTARLVLHPIPPDEARRIAGRAPGPDDRWHPDYPFEDELDPLTSLAGATAPDPVFTLYQVREAASGLAVGGIGFFGPPDEAGAVEIGYGLVAAARGRGLATEAVVAAVRLAAEHGAALLRADTTPANIASQRVLKKAGLSEIRRTGELVYFERRL
ncbi:MAG TPA: GNAT family N-acetyltransferase [Amnibacterium sp.]|nr:GNAT family N-acetyltransferase [Amnibacterium sp.]